MPKNTDKSETSWRTLRFAGGPGVWRRRVRIGAGLIALGVIVSAAGLGWFAAGPGLDRPVRTVEISVDLGFAQAGGKSAEAVASRPGEAEPRDEPAVRVAALPAGVVGDELPWKLFAGAAPAAGETRPMIALIIDDMGVVRAWSERAARLPAPVTLSYLPYAVDVGAQAAAARADGHELLLHLPLEPEDATQDPGPMALLVGLGDDELRWRLAWNLARIDGYVGINNHMGSRFTSDREAMGMVISEVKERGLLFVDSFTIAGSKALDLAHASGIPADRRHVFIDNDEDEEFIIRQLAKLEGLAYRNGYAIGIAHPRPLSLDVLEKWVAGLDERGILLVPVSAVIAQRHGLAAGRKIDPGLAIQ